jgi:hypothetical protein
MRLDLHASRWLIGAGIGALMMGGLSLAGVAGCAGGRTVDKDAGSGTGGLRTGEGTGGGAPGSGTGGVTTGSGTGGTTTGSGTGGTTTSGGVGGCICTGGAPGGGTGGAGTTTPASFAYTFDTTVQGFSLSTYADTSATNLGAANSGAAPAPTATFDGTEGDPDPGALAVAVTFTAYNQYVDAAVNLSPTINLQGKTIHAWVKLVSGSFTGGAILHASTTSTYIYGSGPLTTLVAGQWTQVSFDLTTATGAGWDASQVIQIGLQLLTGAGPTGGVFAGPISAVFKIDTITDGSGGGPTVPPGISDTFDSSTQGFTLNNYADPGATNLGSPTSGSTPTAIFDGVNGDPDPGSLEVTATFTAYNQYVDAIVGVSPAADLTGKILHAKVMLTQGAFTGGVQLHASTTATYVYGAGAFTALTLGQWTDLTLDLSTPTAAGWDPTQVVQVGVEFSTGSGQDGGALPAPVNAIFNIDTITE